MPAPVFKRMAGVFARKFGESATWHPAEGPAFPIRAIYSSAYADVDAGGVAIDSRAPTAWVQEAVVGEADNRCRIDVGGVLWRVVSAEPDGNGMIRLALQR